MLSFRIFDLEADSQCRYDYLDVYNGKSNTVQKLGRFCGTFRPGALISTTNTMMLDMVTDEETHGRGFVAYFSGATPYAEGRSSFFQNGWTIWMNPFRDSGYYSWQLIGLSLLKG